MAGLYIHFPFCEKKCAYCDFYSETFHQQWYNDFLLALYNEIKIYSQQSIPHEPIHTVYFGGGTPSLMPHKDFFALFGEIRDNFSMVRNPEITLEVNPGTIGNDACKRWVDIGITRLSIGAQSFHPHELELLGRIHMSGEIDDVIQSARNAGCSNIGLDLIFGLPNQTLDDWKYSLKEVLHRQPQHLSIYALTWNNNTRIGQQINSGVLPTPHEACVSDMFLLAHELLCDAGYVHYEISNYALPGYECLHNEGYWTGIPYLGLGPSAHSFIGNRRFWNAMDMKMYKQILSQDRLPVTGEEVLSAEHRRLEKITLGLRRKEGVPRNVFPTSDFLEEMIRTGLAEYSDSSVRLTAKGFLLADEVAVQIV